MGGRHTMRRISVVFCAAALMLAFSTGFQANANRPAAATYDKALGKAKALDIAEAVFRFQFGNNASGVQRKAPGYYLELFKADPDAGFLARFKNNEPPVGKASDFKQGQGLIFRVDKIKLVGKDRVEVEGGYYEGNLSASGVTFTVERKDGRWTVTNARRSWIS